MRASSTPAGSHITIWPDQDEVGITAFINYTEKLEAVQEAGGCTGREGLCSLPSQAPAKRATYKTKCKREITLS